MAIQHKRLVREYLERVDGEVLEGEHFRSTLAGMIKGHGGVYALYKGDTLYYVGLATNLMGRVKHHLKDRHARRWNRFSVYLTTAGHHIKPIESLLLRITRPVGNRVQGRLPGARDLKADVNRGVKAQQDDERARLLGATSPGSGNGRRRRTIEARWPSLVRSTGASLFEPTTRASDTGRRCAKTGESRMAGSCSNRHRRPPRRLWGAPPTVGVSGSTSAAVSGCDWVRYGAEDSSKWPSFPRGSRT